MPNDGRWMDTLGARFVGCGLWVDSEAKRIEIIQELADNGGFDPEELLAELGKEARHRMKEEAEMPLPRLSPLLNAPN